jgi:hypothetical protein
MDNIKFSSDTWCSKHTINGLPLCEEETGRVVAVFYNDYEAEYVIERVNSHDALTARVTELEGALKILFAASVEYLEYKHDGDPDNEDARVMGEMELNDLDNEGTIESIKKLLEDEL